MANDIKELRDNFKKFLGLTKLTMQIATNEATEVVLNQMREDTDLRDHTQQQLDHLGNPYSWQHAHESLHHDWQVHAQSGGLQKGLSSTSAVTNNGKIEADIKSSAPYTWYLLLGTVKMRPRDFASAALIQKQHEVSDIYEKSMKEIFENVNNGNFKVEIKLMEFRYFDTSLPD